MNYVLLHKDNYVEVSSIEVGGFFEFDKQVFMRIHDHDSCLSTVNLTDNRYNYFGARDTKVRRLYVQFPLTLGWSCVKS